MFARKFDRLSSDSTAMYPLRVSDCDVRLLSRQFGERMSVREVGVWITMIGLDELNAR
jgi:hypothetical protein